MIEIIQKPSQNHIKMPDSEPETDSKEETMQQLRLKATELLLRKDFTASIQAYTQFISLCQGSNPNHLSKHRKSLSLAFSNRAEAQLKLKQYEQGMKDCESALSIDETCFKGLLCKGKILMHLNKYGMALDCFKKAKGYDGNEEILNGLIEKCKKFDYVSKTGNFDVTDWVLTGFNDKSPELGEFVGCVEVKKSEISGRGLFSSKNVDVGSLILVTKCVASERCILPCNGENAQLVMWKKFIDKVNECAIKCSKTRCLIGKLSTGEDEDELDVPDISLFRLENLVESCLVENVVDMEKILSVLDVNSLVEDAVSAIVLGRNRDYYGVGLWLLPSFINHSCVPNVRRLHIGDHLVVLASRDIKAGEEITFAYYDVLSPLSKRKEMAKSWGFNCRCKRCKLEERIQSKPEFNDIDLGSEKEGDPGNTIFRLEEGMRKCNVRGKDKGYLRASFWKEFAKGYESEKTVRRWGRKIPGLEAVVDSLVEAVGCDERVIKVVVRKMKKSGGGFGEMERALKLGRGVYGKIMKKQALRILLEIGVHQ